MFSDDELRIRLRKKLERYTYRELQRETGLNIRTLHQMNHVGLKPQFDERVVKLLNMLGWKIVG